MVQKYMPVVMISIIHSAECVQDLFTLLERSVILMMSEVDLPSSSRAWTPSMNSYCSPGYAKMT